MIIRHVYLPFFAQLLSINMQLCKKSVVVNMSPAVLRSRGVFI